MRKVITIFPYEEAIYCTALSAKMIVVCKSILGYIDYCNSQELRIEIEGPKALTNMTDADARVIIIEHCKDCKTHDTSTRHDE